MSECVVRMEMPSNCERCPMCGTEGCGNGMYKLWCMCGDIPASSQRRPDDCPIICQLPEGHGRLVDADELESRCRPVKNFENQDSLVIGVGPLRCSKTIVPAERSETEQV